jgi:hypothetical protein
MRIASSGLVGLLLALAGTAAGHASAPAAAPAAGSASAEAAPSCAGQSLRVLAPLAGTPWVGRGAWPDGKPLHVRQHYWFGPTQHVLHFTSHDLSAGEPRLLYEGLLFVDPDDGCARQWNFTPGGKLTRSTLSDLGPEGFVVLGENTRSTVRIEGQRFRWQLDVVRDGKTERVMDAVYERETDSAAGHD